MHVPRRTGASIGCSRGAIALTLSLPHPLCVAGEEVGEEVGGFSLGPPLPSLPKETPTAGGAVPPSLVSVFPEDIPLSVSRQCPCPHCCPCPRQCRCPRSTAQPPGARGTGRRESAVGRAAGWAGGAQGRHLGSPGELRVTELVPSPEQFPGASGQLGDPWGPRGAGTTCGCAHE